VSHDTHNRGQAGIGVVPADARCAELGAIGGDCRTPSEFRALEGRQPAAAGDVGTVRMADRREGTASHETRDAPAAGTQLALSPEDRTQFARALELLRQLALAELAKQAETPEHKKAA
jgi:hypothetical protein